MVAHYGLRRGGREKILLVVQRILLIGGRESL